MEYDLNDILSQMNELESERQKILQAIEAKKQEIDNVSVEETGDVFLDLEARKNTMKEVARKIRQVEKDQKKYEIIFDRQIELVKERDNLINKNYELLDNIKKAKSEIGKIDLKVASFDELISKANLVGGNEEVINALNKQKQEMLDEKAVKEKEIENLEYEREVIFDKSKRKPEEKEEVTESENKPEVTVEDNKQAVEPELNNNETVVTTEENKEENKFDNLLNDLDNNNPQVVNPNEPSEKEADNKSRIGDAVDAIKKGVVDVKQEAEDKMKKRPKSIRNITDWVKNHGKVVLGSIAAIGAVALLLGPGVGVITTAAEMAGAYIGYKASKGK